METLNAMTVSWLEKVRVELGSSGAGAEHPLDGCDLEGARIGRLLGVGSFAAVFELHESGDAPLAVKVLERSAKGEESEREDEIFRREVDIGMQLAHPTITRIHRFVERPRSRFVVLDQVRGQTWNHMLGEKLSTQRYRELFEPLAQGLDYAHQMGVVHRDLKPENVMLEENGAVRILDFGMARKSGGTDVTVTGQFKGTPMYCAPEQIIDSKKVGPACDQFSFGLLSFQLLTGKFPYPIDDKAPLQTLFARLQQPAAKLSSAWPEASPAADEAMAKILAMKPEDRYPSVVEAFQALSAALP
jgi:serine/threonine-protein kinase